jgi:hypothetical protein
VASLIALRGSVERVGLDFLDAITPTAKASAVAVNDCAGACASATLLFDPFRYLHILSLSSWQLDGNSDFG